MLGMYDKKTKKIEHLFLLTQLSAVDSDLTMKLENIFFQFYDCERIKASSVQCYRHLAVE